MDAIQQVTTICNALQLGCRPASDVPESSWAEWLDSFLGIPFPKECPECGKEMQERGGKYGAFWGCDGYPKCKHTENIGGTS